MIRTNRYSNHCSNL